MLLHLPSQVYTCPARHSSVTELAPRDRYVWCGGDQVPSVARWNVDRTLSMRQFRSNQLIRCNVYNPLIALVLVGLECQHFTVLSPLTGTQVRNNYKSHIASQQNLIPTFIHHFKRYMHSYIIFFPRHSYYNNITILHVNTRYVSHTTHKWMTIETQCLEKW